MVWIPLVIFLKIVSNFTRLMAREITYNVFEISLMVFMLSITPCYYLYQLFVLKNIFCTLVIWCPNISEESPLCQMYSTCTVYINTKDLLWKLNLLLLHVISLVVWMKYPDAESDWKWYIGIKVASWIFCLSGVIIIHRLLTICYTSCSAQIYQCSTFWCLRKHKDRVSSLITL